MAEVLKEEKSKEGFWELHAMQVLYQLSYGPKSRNVVDIKQPKDFFHNVRNSYSTL